MTANTTQTSTEVGNYFVSNYPPFSQWKPEYIPEAPDALSAYRTSILGSGAKKNGAPVAAPRSLGVLPSC